MPASIRINLDLLNIHILRIEVTAQQTPGWQEEAKWRPTFIYRQYTTQISRADCTSSFYTKHLVIYRTKKKELPKNPQYPWETSQRLARMRKWRQKARPRVFLSSTWGCKLGWQDTNTHVYKDACFTDHHSFPFSCPRWPGFFIYFAPCCFWGYT